MSLISWWAEAEDREVMTVLATEGAMLYVLKRVEARFEASCVEEDIVSGCD